MPLPHLLAARSRRRSHAPAASDVLIVVSDGYHPSVVTAAAGVPVQLRFRREEGGPFSDTVLFPELGRFAELPEGRTVVLDCGALEAGDYEFSCSNGMLHGTLVVR
jgi:plastocyanin domain-containing protein